MSAGISGLSVPMPAIAIENPIPKPIGNLQAMETVEARACLDTVPLSPSGSYLFYRPLLPRTPDDLTGERRKLDERCTFASMRILYDARSSNPPVFEKIYFCYDPTIGCYFRYYDTQDFDLSPDDFWQNTDDIFRWMGPGYIGAKLAKIRALQQNGVFSNALISSFDESAASQSLSKAPPGVFFVLTDLDPRQNYILCARSEAGLIRYPVSITLKGTLMIRMEGLGYMEFAQIDELMQKLHLTQGLRSWEREQIQLSAHPSAFRRITQTEKKN